ncbi:MAG: helix-turn-helix transcriptional regulator [Clostridia bacterium]|nr:helix-turn-helix transcriptional regulator [Clostridia bacterium]
MKLNIGKNIKKLRRECGASQNELAKYLGVKTQTVSKWEHDICAPDIAMLPEIALFFGVRIEELFEANRRSTAEEALAELEKLCDAKKWHEMADNALAYAKEFPHDARICEMLLISLVQAETCRERTKETDIVFSVHLAKRIISECADVALKQRITYHLCVILYGRGREEEADFYYSTLNRASYSCESLDMYKYKGRELASKLKENNAVWYNMLAMSFSRMAYNMDIGDESINYLYKAHECFYFAYECTNEKKYLRMCVLVLLDIAITRDMLEQGAEAAKCFRKARDFANEHSMEEEFLKITERALKSKNAGAAARKLFERMRAENV